MARDEKRPDAPHAPGVVAEQPKAPAEPAATTPKKKEGDPELLAMSTIAGRLARLDPASRVRVVQWVADRFLPPKGA